MTALLGFSYLNSYLVADLLLIGEQSEMENGLTVASGAGYLIINISVTELGTQTLCCREMSEKRLRHLPI